MTATVHRGITDLALRVAFGVLVLAALVMLGMGITNANLPTSPSVASRP